MAINPTKLQMLEEVFKTASSLPCGAEFTDRVLERVLNNRGGHPDVEGTMYRASSIGKPWILQVLDRWYGGARTYTAGQCMNMLNGVVAQEYVAELLSLCKFGFEQEVMVKHLAVTGHLDLLVKVGGELLVLECKSMAPHMVSGFAANPNDDYGYLSQLSFYVGCVRRMYPTMKVGGAFVLFNRGTGDLRLVPITDSAIDRKVERINQALEVLMEIEPYDVDKLIEQVSIPPTVDGKIPSSMSRSRWSKVFYRGVESGGYVLQPEDVIVRQLKQLPLQRADYQTE